MGLGAALGPRGASSAGLIVAGSCLAVSVARSLGAQVDDSGTGRFRRQGWAGVAWLLLDRPVASIFGNAGHPVSVRPVFPGSSLLYSQWLYRTCVACATQAAWFSSPAKTAVPWCLFFAEKEAQSVLSGSTCRLQVY